MCAAVQMTATQNCDLQVLNPLDHKQLMAIFNGLFQQELTTRLVGGGEEPIYLPRDSQCRHNRIVFTRDYAASALHEVAHWCVAGAARREQEDYGYWYAPDGRSEDQQAEFERVEVKPQAIEWLLSVAAGRSFRVSADNLAAGLGASDHFRESIRQQALTYCAQGTNNRVQRLIEALQGLSHEADALNIEHYQRVPN